MPSTTRQLPLKMRANSAAADTNGTAVTLAELPAAFVSFRWQQPSLPLHKNVNSVASPLFAAVQFSGNTANCARNALTTAISVTFKAFGGA